MRTFEFQLQLPDGRVVAESTAAESWAVAYTEACLNAERHHDLGPWAGIRCVAYSSQACDQERADCAVEIDTAGAMRMDPWTTFAAA